MRFWLGRRMFSAEKEISYEISAVNEGWHKTYGWPLSRKPEETRVAVCDSVVEKLIGTSLEPGEIREIEIEIRLKEK